MWIIGAIIAVAVVLGIFVLVYALKKNRKGTVKETNYKAFSADWICFSDIIFYH